MKRGIVAAISLSLIAVAAIASRGAVGTQLAAAVGGWQNGIAAHIDAAGSMSGARLAVLSLIGGLAASVSPCILGMLPVNLSYIGASGVASRRAAVLLAAMFVSGVALVNIVLGILSALFFAVFIEYRAEINIIVGCVSVVMAFWFAGILRFTPPQLFDRMPRGGSSFIAGVVFALIASPCASPVLVAVLAIASRDGRLPESILAMSAYTAGYTSLLFAASLSAGVAVSSKRLLKYTSTITRCAATAMALIGAATVWYGVSLL